jgi:hypothetical protein
VGKFFCPAREREEKNLKSAFMLDTHPALLSHDSSMLHAGFVLIWALASCILHFDENCPQTITMNSKPYQT